MYQSVFQRVEQKYIITKEQKEKIFSIMLQHMELDQYGRTTIRNIYFDTDNYRLIRRSIEKPAYKEKLRIRSYYKVKKENHVFVEVKKKYDSIVYKRRLSLKEQDALDWVCAKKQCPKNNQIASEIQYFLDYYETLSPKVFLSYEREAYYLKEKGDLRITFDENILFREEELSLEKEVWGTSLLDSNLTLMEIKTSRGIPLWLCDVLSELKVYKTSFSKYGNAYLNYILPRLQEEKRNG